MPAEPTTTLDSIERGEGASTTEDEATRPAGFLAGAKRRVIRSGKRRPYLDNIRRPQQSPVDEESRSFDPTDKFWSQYLAAADERDDTLVEVWKGEADAILIFTGLFAATVATFLVQTYQLLSPASTDTSAAALLQISQQLAGAANGTTVPAYMFPPFEVPAYAVRVNALWFLSLLISISCALLATLMQGWVRSYLFDVPSTASPHTRGRLHALLSFGAERFKITEIIGLIVTLLHIAVILFVLGLLDFISTINSVVHSVFLTAAIVFASLYGVFTIIPIMWPDAPYRTPLTPLLRMLLLAVATILLLVALVLYVVAVLCTICAIALPFICCIVGTRAEPIFDAIFDKIDDGFSVLINPLGTVIAGVLIPDRLERLRTRIDSAGLPMTRVQHAIRQVTQPMDENHELEAFLDVFKSFLEEPYLDQVATVSFLFTNINIVTRLLSSCSSLDATEDALVRAHRLSAISQLLYTGSASKAVLGKSPATFKSLLHDSHPHISFLACILLFGVRNNIRNDDEYTKKEKKWSIRKRHLEQHVWNEDAFVPRDHGWFEDDAITLSKSLTAFLRFTCIIVYFASLDGPSNPINIYLSDWEPILNGLRDWTLEELKSHSETGGGPIFSITLHKLLEDGGLSGFVYPCPPGVVPVQFSHDFRRGIEAIPSTCVKDALRAVAEALPAQPPRSPGVFSPAHALRAATVAEALLAHAQQPPFLKVLSQAAQDQAAQIAAPTDSHEVRKGISLSFMLAHLASSHQERLSIHDPLSSTVARVALGPLSWGKRPVLEFRALLNWWRMDIVVHPSIPVILAEEQPYAENNPQSSRTFDITGIIDYLQDVRVIDNDTANPSRNRQGSYATIDFANEQAAMRFIDAWKQKPPSGYYGVTAQIYQDETVERRDTEGLGGTSTAPDVQMEGLA